MLAVVCFSGLELCLGKPLDDTLLQVIRREVQQLSDSFKDYRDKEGKDVRSICSTIALFKSQFDTAMYVLQQQQSSLQGTYEELKNNQDTINEKMVTRDKEHKELFKISDVHWKMRQEQVESFCKTLEVKSAAMQRDLDILKATMTSLTPYDDSKEIVFDAPEQNKWFTGRQKEVNILEKCLPFESDSRLKMAAICGLGGCGKTTLAVEYAWKHKQIYEGGVYWVSMEDDRKFENSMNDLALRLGMLADSFDLTLSKVLTWISKGKRPWLLVFDDVDQLNLSEQMHRVLSGRWKRQASGHVLLTTRRERKEICETINLEPSCCVDLNAFSEDEAKTFLVARSDVSDATGEEVVLDDLVRELGCLPLALEQAGAHIKALQCSVSSYLEEYKTRRIKLLSQHPRAKPSWEYESENRLAVHTTWLLNFEYVSKSPHREVATSFVQTAAFLAPNEIQEELINSQLLSADHPPCHNFNLKKSEIVEVLTKFSLFQRKTAKSLGLHRLVQEVIRNRMTAEETASSLLTAVRILSQSFRDCPSPDRILTDITASVQERASLLVSNPSLFYMWSKLASHASELEQYLKGFLDQQDIERDVKTVVLTREASRIVYENAVKLSVHGHQEEAKESERFAFQILASSASDSLPITLDELTELFPHTLPLPQLLQKTILYSSRPPTENQTSATGDKQSVDIDEIRLRGNAFFKQKRFKESVETYTEAIEGSSRANHLDPRLLNNRATAYLKLGKFEECLQDSEEYIKLMPNCWKGYTRKALALSALAKKGSALCSAAIAYYHDAKSCRRYEAFQSAFKDLDEKWEVVDSSEALKRSLLRNKSPKLRKKVLLLTKEQYEIEDAQQAKMNELTFVLKNSDGSNDIVGTTLAAFGNGQHVTITCGGIRLSKECFIQNVSFCERSAIFVGPDGDVEFTNCSFRSTNTLGSAIVVYGKAKLLQCIVSDSPGGGITVEGLKSSASLIKCKVNGNGKKPRESSGIKVINGGSIKVNECSVHGNTEGINVFGTERGNIAKQATVEDSEIYDNRHEGVRISGDPNSSSAVVLRRNKIYHNGGHGTEVSFHANYLRFEENVIFENFWWGVWVQCNSGGHFKGNEICNNKMGGIRVGRQSPGKPACVIENNVIHDNCGPAFHEGLHLFEVYSFPRELHAYFQRHHEKKYANLLRGQRTEFEFSFPDAVLAEYKSNNQCYQNAKPTVNLQAGSSKRHCAFCFGSKSKAELKFCKRCRTASYCGRECQMLHWGRHKYICEAIAQRNVIEVSIPVCAADVEVIRFRGTHPSLEAIGPLFASPPPRDGTRFIVKIQTFEGLRFGNKFLDPRGYVSDEYNPDKAKMTIYDRSLSVDFEIARQPRLYHLIMECGIMGSSMYLAKKLFCWGAFKDGKTLKIFTHEFPPEQRW